ncbi:hypothetical protein GZL_09137 [Streptomyces sp. 769]|nr:hypothetical protein GZL_09137 [Streptomyces sp. 769]
MPVGDMPLGRVATDAHHRPIHVASHKNRTELRKERHRPRNAIGCGNPRTPRPPRRPQFSQWDMTFTDPRVRAAISDRLTSKVASIRTDTDA